MILEKLNTIKDISFKKPADEKAFFSNLGKKVSNKFLVPEYNKLQKQYASLFTKMGRQDQAKKQPPLVSVPKNTVTDKLKPAPESKPNTAPADKPQAKSDSQTAPASTKALPKPDTKPADKPQPKPRANPPAAQRKPTLFGTSERESLFLLEHTLSFICTNRPSREALQSQLIVPTPSRDAFLKACREEDVIQQQLNALSADDLTKAYQAAFPDKAPPFRYVLSPKIAVNNSTIKQRVNKMEAPALKEAYKKLFKNENWPKQKKNNDVIHLTNTRKAILDKINNDQSVYEAAFGAQVFDKEQAKTDLFNQRIQPSEEIIRQYFLHSFFALGTIPKKEDLQTLLTDIQGYGIRLDDKFPCKTLLVFFELHLLKRKTSSFLFPFFTQSVARKNAEIRRTQDEDIKVPLTQDELFQSLALLRAPAGAEAKPVTATPYTFPKKGLYNATNSCYLNATIQSLVHVPSFHDFIQQQAKKTPKPSEAQFVAACTIARFLPPNNSRTEQQEIRALYTALFPGKPFPEATEQDCQLYGVPVKERDRCSLQLAGNANRERLAEMARPIISSFLTHASLELMEELKKGSGALDSSFSKKMRLYAIEAGFDATSEISQEDSCEFFGFLSKQVGLPQLSIIVKEVKKDRITEAPALSITPSSQGPASLQEILDPSLLLSRPQILPITIGRFLGNEKNTTPLTLPFELTIPDKEGDKTVQRKYRLRSVSIHDGNSPKSGHYYNYSITYTKEKTPEYSYFSDDEVVTPDDKEKLLPEAVEEDIATQATLVIYERVPPEVQASPSIHAQ